MSKALFITEKPSVATEFAKALKIKTVKRNGYLESDRAIITWCVGHLVNMSYPEEYDIKFKKWLLEDLPFLPEEYKYEVIGNVKKQFEIVRSQMLRDDIATIYVCTDSGREGEYIYRLVDEKIGVQNKVKKRVWIDSQTEDEIRRGVKEAKPLYDYDRLSNSAYLRAKEDYLIGINFSRLLTLIYGNTISRYLGEKYTVIAIGRVMTCVLAMIVNREREIRNFVKTPYYKVNCDFLFNETLEYNGEWKSVEGSKYFSSNLLFKETGFREKVNAEIFIEELKKGSPDSMATILSVKKKTEKKRPPLLFNLAELQNICSKKYKLSPNDTLKVVQTLYERKMLTYPRTDARVLSTAIAKEIHKNIRGLLSIESRCELAGKDQEICGFVKNIMKNEDYKGLEKTKYVNDKAITDHYAIIPTGQGLDNYNRLQKIEKDIYLLVVRRFLAVFYPEALFNKLTITTQINDESFFTSSKVCVEEGYLKILESDKKKNDKVSDIETLKQLKKGQRVKINNYIIKESETTPPKRYNSGSIILAMENAGKLIEDEGLREQIKGQGIGTSATRASILEKLNKISYINLNKKTQILSPTAKGEMIFDVTSRSVPSLLKPELTASWEKGLTMVANGDIEPDIYMDKLESYISKNVTKVLGLENKSQVWQQFSSIPNSKPKKKAKKERSKNSFGECIVCSGDILENSKSFYCSNWREGCKFSIWKNTLDLYRQKVDAPLVEKLLSKGKIEDLDIYMPQTREKCRATLVFRTDNTGALDLKNVKRIEE